jgi:hypothetical protein
MCIGASGHPVSRDDRAPAGPPSGPTVTAQEVSYAGDP